MKEYPNPDNNIISRELFDFIGEWRSKYNLTSLQEIFYLSCLLTGRLDVQVLLEKIKKEWKVKDEDIDI